MQDATGQLALLSRARQAIEKARSVDEVKDIRDKAEAIRQYAKAQGECFEIQQHAAEVKLRAERKAGELLAEMEKNKGGRKTGNTLLPVQKLADVGVEKIQSSRWQNIASVPAPVFERHIEETRQMGEELTTAGVLRLAKLTVKKERKAKATEPSEPAAVPAAAPAEAVALEALSASGHKFACIYADPPWAYSNQATRASTDNHYATMSVEQIAALPVADLAAERAHLWLWTTNAFLFECPRLFAAWGFEFKSSYVWCKTQIGIGNYLRNAHEFLLLAVRGGMTAAARDVKSWGEFPRGKHSAKPEVIRGKVIERVSPGPRLELFGRRLAPGWTVWGNQIERTVFDTDVA